MSSVTSSIGIVEGPTINQTMVCQVAHMVNAKGCVWFGGNPFAFAFPTLLLQLAAIFATTRAVWFLTKPLKQDLIIAQLIGGILLSPALLGHNYGIYQKLFPPEGRMMLETIADVGLMIHYFILGVQINRATVTNVKRKATVIGVSSFFLPFFAAQLISRVADVDEKLKNSIYRLSSINTSSSFMVITSLLYDLKILNSNIGRIAAPASLVCEICSLSTRHVLYAYYMGSIQEMAVFIGSMASMILIVIYGFRPIISYISRHVAQNGSLNDIQFFAIMLVAIICENLGQNLGNNPGESMFILGLFIPDGPGIGSSLINKMNVIPVGLFLPVKLVLSGLKVDVYSLGGFSGAILGLAMFASFVAKFFGSLLPAFYYKMPFKNAAALSLVMCCRGVVEAYLCLTMVDSQLIPTQEYTILIVGMYLTTGIARPLISHLYDPSTDYSRVDRKGIMYVHPNDEVQMLVCVQDEGNVSPIMNLLRISNPPKSKSMSIVVLSLMELQGRATPLLEPTHQTKNLNSVRSWPEKVANAFDQLAQQLHDNISFRCFTSISPYASMHDDICTLALEQDTDMVIVPFHKQWVIDGADAIIDPNVRTVNQNVLLKSPCSVGVLIDPGQVEGGRVLLNGQNSMFSVCLFFIGGDDDCEALAYVARFVDNPKINLTLLWIRLLDEEGSIVEQSMEKKMVQQFRAMTIGNKRVSYIEELVSNAVETTEVIRTIEGRCDLCIVGRHHDPDSQILSGLLSWSEYPELGAIGDLLVNFNFRFSVLVVQHQPPTTGLVDNSGFDLPPVPAPKVLSGDS